MPPYNRQTIRSNVNHVRLLLLSVSLLSEQAGLVRAVTCLLARYRTVSRSTHLDGFPHRILYRATQSGPRHRHTQHDTEFGLPGVAYLGVYSAVIRTHTHTVLPAASGGHARWDDEDKYLCDSRFLVAESLARLVELV